MKMLMSGGQREKTATAFLFPAYGRGTKADFLQQSCTTWVSQTLVSSIRAVGADPSGVTIQSLRHSAFIWSTRANVSGND